MCGTAYHLIRLLLLWCVASGNFGNIVIGLHFFEDFGADGGEAFENFRDILPLECHGEHFSKNQGVVILEEDL